MKKIKQFGKIAFLALALTFVSCSSDSDGSSTTTGGDGTISGKVDGKTVSSNSLATIASLSGGGGFQMLSVSGTDLGGDGFTITISGYTGVGTYQATSDTDKLAVCSYIDFDMNNPQNTNNVWTSPYDIEGTSGSVVITEQTDTRVKGTFSFKGANNTGSFKNVTNGTFNVKLTKF